MRHALLLPMLALAACATTSDDVVVGYQAPLSVSTSRLAAVGPAEVDSFTVSCATSATPITPPSGSGMLSYTCQNVSTTIVGVGDSGITDPDSGTRNSPVYCATNCPAQEWGGNARREYCRADSGTVTIYCRALTPFAGN